MGERLSKLRTLWLNGEVVTRTLARRAMELLPDARLLNVYSCSETHEVAAGDLGELVENPESTYCAVGAPMDPEHLYLLDADGERVPEGEAGSSSSVANASPAATSNCPRRPKRASRKILLLEERRKDVSLGRQGPHPLRREPGDPRPRGLYGQDPGLQRRAGRRRAAIEEGLAVKSCVVVSEGEEGEDKRLVAYIVPDPEDDERYSGWSLDPKTGRSKEGASCKTACHTTRSLPSSSSSRRPIQATSGKVDRSELPPPPSACTQRHR